MTGKRTGFLLLLLCSYKRVSILCFTSEALSVFLALFAILNNDCIVTIGIEFVSINEVEIALSEEWFTLKHMLRSFPFAKETTYPNNLSFIKL